MITSHHFGFIKVATAVPVVSLANCFENAESIIRLTRKAIDAKAQLICFPELSITGSSCGDLFQQTTLLQQAKEALQHIIASSTGSKIVMVVGLPIRVENQLFNVAAVLQSGQLLGLVPKPYTYSTAQENDRRWFSSGQNSNLQEITFLGKTVPFSYQLRFGEEDCYFSIEIGNKTFMLNQAVNDALPRASLILNPCANYATVGSHEFTLQSLLVESKKNLSAIVMSSSGWGESTTDVVYPGGAYVFEYGKQLAASTDFLMQEQLVITEIDCEKLMALRLRSGRSTQTDTTAEHTISLSFSTNDFTLSRCINPTPFIPPAEKKQQAYQKILNIQAWGLAKRIEHTQSKACVLGISGGLDSTLALLVCVRAYDLLQRSRKEIIGISMPGFATSKATYTNAKQLIEALGISSREIDIQTACMQHFADIGHEPELHDVTYENTQARERTQILMDVANQVQGLVVGTGNLSEIALGWSTYNGDHMSMYAVNAGVPKTLVRELVHWQALHNTDDVLSEVLATVLETPISPELLPVSSEPDKQQPTQITEDIVGPYVLHDFFLYYALGYGFMPKKIYFLAQLAFKGVYDNTVLEKWLRVFTRRFFTQQFKRSCMPDGPKIGRIHLSPRGDWKMPSDAHFGSWIKQ